MSLGSNGLLHSCTQPSLYPFGGGVWLVRSLVPPPALPLGSSVSCPFPEHTLHTAIHRDSLPFATTGQANILSVRATVRTPSTLCSTPSTLCSTPSTLCSTFMAGVLAILTLTVPLPLKLSQIRTLGLGTLVRTAHP